MSSISQTPKMKTVRNINNRILNLFVVVALVVTLGVLFTSIVGSPAAKPIDQNENAYMIHRQGEWLSVPVQVSNAEAYQIFRLGEWASVNVTAMDITAYHLSERTSVPINFTKYQRSEWFGE